MYCKCFIQVCLFTLFLLLFPTKVLNFETNLIDQCFLVSGFYSFLKKTLPQKCFKYTHFKIQISNFWKDVLSLTWYVEQARRAPTSGLPGWPPLPRPCHSVHPLALASAPDPCLGLTCLDGLLQPADWASRPQSGAMLFVEWMHHRAYIKLQNLGQNNR